MFPIKMDTQPRIDQCLMKNQKPDTRFRSLSLRGMSFAFFVLGFGLGLAAIAFAVEFVYNRLKNVRNQKQYSNIIGLEIKPIRKSKPAIITKMTLVERAPIVDIQEVPTAFAISHVGNTEIPK